MLLFFIFLFLFFCLFFIFFTSEKYILFIKKFRLFITEFVFILSLILLINFNFDSRYYSQYLITITSNLDFNFCIYSFSLVALLLFLCVLFYWQDLNAKEHFFHLIFLELLLLQVISVLDLILFYIFFEAILIPMFLIIGNMGSKSRIIRAYYLLFFYTLIVIGSILMLLGIIYIYLVIGTSNLEILFTHQFSFEEQKWLWLAFFVSFASKIPMFPFSVNLISFFVLTVAAAESSIGLAIIITYYRIRGSIKILQNISIKD